MEFDELSGKVIGCALDVHKQLGPGLLESVYEECLCRELERRGIPFRRQVEVPVLYKGESVKTPLRLDLLVNDAIVVELKAVEKLLPIHEAQMLTYLKLTNKRIGLILNFNVKRMKDGIKRMML